MDLETINKQFEKQLQEQEKEKNKEEMELVHKGKKKKYLLIGVFFLLFAAVLAATFLPKFINSGKEGNEAPNVEAAIMDGLPEGITEEDLLKSLQEEMDGSMYKLTQQSRVVFKNGSAEGTVNIINAEGNQLPTRVVITLTEDETTLYDSNDLIWPGKYIPSIRMQKKLEKGSYDATVTYHVYDKEGKNEKGIMSAAMEIIVQQ